MKDIIEQIEGLSNKEEFLKFIQILIIDYKENIQEWENKTVNEYLEAMKSWIEDYSSCKMNDVDWDKIDYKTFAKILYMGKIYE